LHKGESSVKSIMLAADVAILPSNWFSGQVMRTASAVSCSQKMCCAELQQGMSHGLLGTAVLENPQE